MGSRCPTTPDQLGHLRRARNTLWTSPITHQARRGLHNRPRLFDNKQMSHSAVLGSAGAIAQRLGNYEARPQQLEMADAVATAIAERRHLMVEAGTGVGKSFAYLVPAIQAALADKDCRVVVSTHTIGLQEQLIRKDIPFLQSVIEEPFLPLLVKGRGNYLSKRRLRVALQRGINLLSEARALDQ